METQKIAALWSHVHWLTVLAQQGSFTAAAAHLSVSKAAMSQRIAELEKAAGISLVSRTTRSVRLTEAGQTLVEKTVGAFDQIAQSFEGVRELAEVPQGLLRLTAPVAFTRKQLVPKLPEFLHSFPKVRLELDMSDHLSALAVDGFDLAIRHAATLPDTHIAWALCKTRTVLVASPDYLDSHGMPSSPDELSQHACLHYPRAKSPVTWSFERRSRSSNANRVTLPVHGPLAVNNSEALSEAVQSGLGITLLPDFTAQEALNSGVLVELLPDWSPVGVFGDTLYAIRPYSSHVPRAVRVLVDFLRQAFRSGFPVQTKNDSVQAG